MNEDISSWADFNLKYPSFHPSYCGLYFRLIPGILLQSWVKYYPSLSCDTSWIYLCRIFDNQDSNAYLFCYDICIFFIIKKEKFIFK